MEIVSVDRKRGRGAGGARAVANETVVTGYCQGRSNTRCLPILQDQNSKR